MAMSDSEQQLEIHPYKRQSTELVIDPLYKILHWGPWSVVVPNELADYLNALQAENARLKEALREIAFNRPSSYPAWELAHAALEGGSA